MPMRASEAEGRTIALKDVWLVRKEYNELAKWVSSLSCNHKYTDSL